MIAPPEEVVDARRCLEAAEKELNPERKIEELEEGVELLDLYIEENPDMPESTRTLIINLRRSHTRRLLVQLFSLKEIEIENWFKYIVLLITKLKNEMDYVTSQDTNLKISYDQFFGIYGDVFVEAIRGYKEK